MSNAFQLFFRGLARHAPGTDDDTRRALGACELPDAPNVLDLGAGTGSSTLVLAEELPQGHVTAVDLMSDSLRTLRERAERRGLTNVETLHRDFLELSAPEESVDLIWSEGSIYAVGWERALDAWTPLLAANGHLVATDCVWTTDDRPAEAVEFWNAEYPEMGTVDSLVETLESHGYTVVETFELDRTGWLDYYGPIRQRAQLFGSSNPAEDMAQVIDGMNREVEMFEEHGHAWNYAFVVARRTADG